MNSVQFEPNVIEREDTRKFDLRQSSTQSTLDNTEKIRNWINEKSIKGIQERADSDLIRTRNVYDPLLETENTFVKDINNFLSHRKLTQQRKKEILHKKWNDRVYEPMVDQIEQIMGGSYYPDLREVRLKEFDNYLQHRNQLGHVFLETFDVEQYDPMKVVTFDKTYDKNKVRYDRSVDPLVSQQTFRKNEEDTIMRCETGHVVSGHDGEVEQKEVLVPQGRQGVGSREWIKFPERDIDSKVRFESRKRMRGLMLNGEFDHRQWQALEDTVLSSDWVSEKSDQYDNNKNRHKQLAAKN
ncbi:protein FAM228B-like [Symsagittifera roscoffensis]|uniref:protein FAM228B-like n=1 Tax=Symsagittifera roscoffensis TaxID=84072 RepID=UPI00307BA3BC